MGQGGAAFAAYLRGQKVVDLWGVDARPGWEWKEDTVSLLYSATKVAPAVVAMLTYDRGQIALDAPVALYWPEFAANGKEAITVRQLLAMQARFPYVPGYEGLLAYNGGGWNQFEKLERRIAQAAPITQMRTSAYAIANFGFLVNAIVRRVTGRAREDIWNEDVAAPLGLDLSLGAPDAVLSRMAQVYNPDVGPLPSGSLLARAFHEAEGEPAMLEALAEFGSNLHYLRSGQGSADMLGTARSIARLYAMLANGGSIESVNIVSPDTVAAFTTVQSTEPGLVRKEMGAAGPSSWMLGGIEGNRETGPGQPMIYGPGPRSFGKEGTGGQNGFADPDAGLSVGFLRNQLSFKSPLQRHLIEALYSCLPSVAALW